MSIMSEYTVETVALDWLAGLGWEVAYGPEIAPDTAGAERGDYDEVVLEGRLHAALDRLNPSLPANALEDAFQRLTHPQGATLETRNRAFHYMAVDGVAVEYRDTGGAIRGAQVRVFDFDHPRQQRLACGEPVHCC